MYQLNLSESVPTKCIFEAPQCLALFEMAVKTVDEVQKCYDLLLIPFPQVSAGWIKKLKDLNLKLNLVFLG